MSPIPKPPKAKSPVEKVIEQMLAEAAKGAMPTPTAVIVHPRDAKPDGPLMKAWREQQERMKNNPPLTLGRPQPVVIYDEAGDSLLKDLQDSLWAIATLHTPVFTQEMLYDHVGPGHMEDDWYVKRVFPNEVHLLCKCRMILVLARCRYDWENEFGQMQQCEELAFPQEATLRKDSRCSQHMGTQRGPA